MKTLWKCEVCGKICTSDEILKADHPFDECEFIYGCPKCRDIDTFQMICEHEGCERVSTCGFPTKDGYKNLCGEHAKPFFKE